MAFRAEAVHSGGVGGVGLTLFAPATAQRTRLGRRVVRRMSGGVSIYFYHPLRVPIVNQPLNPYLSRKPISEPIVEHPW